MCFESTDQSANLFQYNTQDASWTDCSLLINKSLASVKNKVAD